MYLSTLLVSKLFYTLVDILFTIQFIILLVIMEHTRPAGIEQIRTEQISPGVLSLFF